MTRRPAFITAFLLIGAFASLPGCGTGGGESGDGSGPRSNIIVSHPTPSPTPTPTGGAGHTSAALAPVAGGTMTNRLHSSVVGVGKQQSILSSPSYRVIGNVQGALYGNP